MGERGRREGERGQRERGERGRRERERGEGDYVQDLMF